MERKLYTHTEFVEKVKREIEAGPIINIGGVECQRGKLVQIIGVEKWEVDGMPCMVVVHEAEDGEVYGVIMDRQYANELLDNLGPHPVVEEFFRLH